MDTNTRQPEQSNLTSAQESGVPNAPSTQPQSAMALDSRPSHSAAADQGNNLGKVRDILFGSQMRDYDKRFARLEERLVKVSTELKDDVRKRFDSLETYVKQEVGVLTDQIKAEQNQRAEALNNLARELKDTSANLDKKIVQLDEQTTKNQRDLRQQLLEQSKTLSNDMQQRYEEISAAIDQAVQELRTDKTDRNTLADLFTEVAMRLNNEFTIPDD